MIKKIKQFVENYFLMLFDKYFKIYIKPYFITEQFDVLFNDRFANVFRSSFDKELNNKLCTLDVNEEEILRYIQIAETKIRSGDGSIKLEFVCDYYTEKNQEAILNVAKSIIKSRVESVFDKHKNSINSMIMDEPVCL